MKPLQALLPVQSSVWRAATYRRVWAGSFVLSHVRVRHWDSTSAHLPTHRHASTCAFVAGRLRELIDASSPSEGDAYRTCTLDRRNSTVRGNGFALHCRDIYGKVLYPGAPEPCDPPSEMCSKGEMALGPNNRSYDFLSGTERVEVKSARFAFNGTRWAFGWWHVKRWNFDKLLLVGYTPDDVIYWEWDGFSYYAEAGWGTHIKGGQIRITAKARASAMHWRQALVDVKSATSWKVLSHTPVSSVPSPRLSRTESLYTDDVLANMPHARRGSILATLCQELHSMLFYPGSYSLVDVPDEPCINGAMRGKHRSVCDFVASGKRVKVKSCLLQYEQANSRWKVYWQNIKEHLFDRLILIAVTPVSILIWEWNGTDGRTRRGQMTDISGIGVTLYGCRGQDWPDAIERIKQNTSCRLLLEVSRVRAVS